MDCALSLMTARGALFAPYVQAGLAPKAVWDFASGLFAAAWTLSRDSEARWFDSDGTLKLAARNEARLISTAEGRALLLEGASMNRLSPGATTGTALSSMAAGPTVGGVAFTTVTSPGDGSIEFSTCDITGLSTASVVTFSLVVRAGTASGFQLWLGVGTGGSSRVRSTVDLSVPSHAISANPDGPAATASVTALGNGSYRLALSGAIIAPESFEQCRITGLNGSIHFALPQFEAGAGASSVMPAYHASRAADTVSFAVPSGSYSARIRRIGQADVVTPVTVAGNLWTPTLTGKVKSVALY